MEILGGQRKDFIQCSGKKIVQAACGSGRYASCGDDLNKLWCQRGQEGVISYHTSVAAKIRVRPVLKVTGL